MKHWEAPLPTPDQHERTENETSAWESEILAVEEKSREDTGPGTLAGAEKTGSRTLDLGTGGHTTRRADQQKTDAG
jgi:hypothetical protein